MPLFQIIMIPIYLPGALSAFMRKLLINLVHEKNEKFKENQKVF